MPKRSAGLLLFRGDPAPRIELFLVHPGGPFWARKDQGAWSLPKGEYTPEEDPLQAALREFHEETGISLDANAAFLPLGELRQPGGKIVTAWALEKDVDAAQVKSNLFSIEWPPQSGQTRQFPEVDRAAWFPIPVAQTKLLKGQLPFIHRLAEKLGIISDPAAARILMKRLRSRRRAPLAVPPPQPDPPFECGHAPASAIMEFVPYDLIVIGSGPGGYSAAIRAGQFGLKTALIEKQARLGGTCLLVGCIPTKSLLHTADVWERFLHSDKEGISCENPRLEYLKVKERKDGIVSKHSKGVEFLLKRAKVDRVTGYATLGTAAAPAPGALFQVQVQSPAGIQTLEAKNIIVATGSEARMIPGLQPDADFILTNIEILDLTAVPKSLIVIGAGAVGVEFASIFRRFGTDVTVVEMLPRIVPVEDEDVSKELERAFKKQKIRVETGARASDIQKTATGVKLTLTTKDGKQEQLEAEKLLVAVGRKPNTDNIGLENTRVQLDRGFIQVDQNQQTAETGIYAIGDVVAGTPQLAHVATREGMIAVAHIAGKPAIPINKNRIPGCTYTDPGIGSVGMTEAQARAQGRKVKVGKFPFAGNSKATILGKHDGFVKVVADEQYGEILGVHIIGPEAFELIAEAVTAMEAEATVDLMMQTIHAHPTLYEAVGEAFNAVYGLSINA